MRKIRAATCWSAVKTGILVICAGWFTTYAGFGQTPPPNDNYSNRIVLTGSDITFSGTLAGATLEDSREIDAYENFYNPSVSGVGSIWWTWTAPTDATLVLQVLNPSNTTNQMAGNLIAVYSATNGSTSPAGLVQPALGILPEYPQIAPQTLAISVTNGSNYQIQLIGDSSASFTLRLVASNTPIIITQPRSQTVYSNASALFYVMYAGAGQTSFTFQWYLNGTNLSGETAPMLALTNIDASMAGAYTVGVSNAAGVTFSQPATLTVSQSNYPVILAAVGATSNSYTFSVSGEPWRNYRLQTSTNLVNWVSAVQFPEAPFGVGDVTSVFACTNTPQILTVTNTSKTAFFRVTPYVIPTPDAEDCINNLEQIRIAKYLWIRDDYVDGELYVSPLETPAESDISQYFPHGIPPSCPDDFTHLFSTSYLIQNLQTVPFCEIHPTNHIVEAPQ